MLATNVRDELYERGATMCFRRVPVAIDERVSGEQPLHGRALDALASPVNQPHDREACLVRGHQVLFDDRDDVARRERVQIDRVFDRNADRTIFIHRSGRCKAQGLGLTRPCTKCSGVRQAVSPTPYDLSLEVSPKP